MHLPTGTYLAIHFILKNFCFYKDCYWLLFIAQRLSVSCHVSFGSFHFCTSADLLLAFAIVSNIIKPV
jgi:hypothetical protein